MTLSEYQKSAARTINPDLTPVGQEHHALYGLCSEVGEIHGLFQKVYQGHPMDETHLAKEIGDALWMLAELCTAHGFDMDEIAQMNIDKLKERYPKGFNAEQSLRRAEGDI